MPSIGFDDAICSFLFFECLVVAGYCCVIYTLEAKVDCNELIGGRLKLSDLQNILPFYL